VVKKKKVGQPPGDVPPPMFDQQIVDELKPAIQGVLDKHAGIVRSIGVFIDYRGKLNHTDGVNRGIWIGREGPIVDVDAIVGSGHACLYLSGCVLDRLVELHSHLSQEIADKLKQIGALDEQAKKHAVKKREGAEEDEEPADEEAGDEA